MNKKKIVVISGKQYSGKDTVANVFKEIFPEFKLAPIADAIKIEFGEKKNLTFNEVDRNKPLYRAELIQFANEIRERDPDYWINKVLNSQGDLLVSDLRMRREFKKFNELGAIKIRVESDRDERAKRGRLVEECDPTETELDNEKNWDFVIENNGTIEELQLKAKKIAEKVMKELTKTKV